MSLSQWFRRRATSSDSQGLLTALLDGFARQDRAGLKALIDDNAARIRTEFQSWMTVAEDIRDDPKAVERYVRTLAFVAFVFEQSGDSSLKQCLESGGREMEDVLRQATRLTDEGHAAKAVALLRSHLDTLRGATGTGVDRFRALLLGRLGIALAKLGETVEAIRVTREALELCRQSGDEEGVRAYTANLDVIASVAISDSVGQGRYRVVFTDGAGRTITPEELPDSIAHVKWEIRDVGEINPEAKRLHDEGRAAGAQGDIDAAIALFNQAAALDPAWPYPVYDRAFSHLLQEDFDAALADYRKTLELAPTGFFVAATAADMLTREAAGEFPRGLYAAFATLEHMTREQRASIAAQLVEQFPTHAPAWELHAPSVKDPAARLEAINQGLAARPDPDTRASLLVQKAFALDALGDHDGALAILDAMTTSVADSIATPPKAMVALAMLRSRNRRPAGE